MLARRAALGLTMVVIGCGSGAEATQPKSPVDEVEPEEPQAEAETPAPGGPSSWSEVEPNVSSDQRPSRISKKYSYIDVQSDPEAHGPELRFHFTVDGVEMDGVFVAPGGQTTNFRLPSGVVTYSNDECASGGGGFEIKPGERITLACFMTSDGDCCEPRIEDEAKTEEGAGEGEGKGKSKSKSQEK
jgi:hypothetical protein